MQNTKFVFQKLRYRCGRAETPSEGRNTKLEKLKTPLEPENTEFENPKTPLKIEFEKLKTPLYTYNSK